MYKWEWSMPVILIIGKWNIKVIAMLMCFILYLMLRVKEYVIVTRGVTV